jgi:hypothetical protein
VVLRYLVAAVLEEATGVLLADRLQRPSGDRK